MEEHEFSPDRIYQHLIDTGTEWADAEHAAALLEESRKSVLADIKTQSAEKSDAARETEALASTGYREHVRAMCDARHAANLARVRYDAAKVLAEARRTQQATLRAQMGLV